MARLFTSFPDIENHHIIIGGDFNMVQDTELDRSSSKAASLLKAAKTLDIFTITAWIVRPMEG